MTHKQYVIGTRWVALDCRVWEKRNWGWKFLGFAKSKFPAHILEVPSTECDHPDDVFHEELQ